MDTGFTHHCAVNRQLNHGFTHIAVGGKHTVFNGTQSSIRKLPYGIVRDLRCSTGRADAGSRNIHLRVRRHILVFSGQDRALKHIGRRRQGSDDQSAGDRALRAVGGTVYNFNGILAFGTGSIGRRTAAVQVDSANTAGLQHDLRELVHGAAAGEGLLASVQNHHDHLAVSSHTDTGTGVTVGIISAAGIGGDIRAILNKQLAAANGLLHSAMGCHSSIPICIVCAAKGSTVLKNSKPGTVIGFIGRRNTVDHKSAGRLTGRHIVEVTVGTYDGFVVFTDKAVFFFIGEKRIRICHLIGQL